VKENYYISDINGSTLNPIGQILLSKHPFRTLICCFSPKKNLIIGHFLINGVSTMVPVVHLTSDHEKYGPNPGSNKRKIQLDIIHDAVNFKYNSKVISEDDKRPDCFLLGDFNQDDPQSEDETLNRGFRDAWTTLYPTDPGITFDTENNFLARLNSKKHPRRLDRIYIRSDQWKEQKLLIFGNKAKELPPEVPGEDPIQLFPSDHYGLFALLDVNPTSPLTIPITVPTPPTPDPQPENKE